MKESLELFLRRFKEYNTVRFANDPATVKRINELTLADIQFSAITADPQNSPDGRVGNFTSPTRRIEGIDQRWHRVPIADREIVNVIHDPVYPALTDLVTLNKQGLYHRLDNTTVRLVAILSARAVEKPGNLTVILKKMLDENTNYIIKTADIVDITETPTGYTVKISNDTIIGEIDVLIQDQNRLTGNRLLGYYGEFTSTDLISGETIAEMVGLNTAGGVLNPDPGWLKFSVEGKQVYVAKRPIRNQVPYNSIEGLGLAKGSYLIEINGDQYRLRLLSGQGTGNEWDKLMYRVHKDDPTGTYWERFSNEDLVVGTDSSGKELDGSYTWTNDETGANTAVYRGNVTLRGTGVESKSTVDKMWSWRPVLELVGVEDVTEQPMAIPSGLRELFPLASMNTMTGVLTLYISQVFKVGEEPTGAGSEYAGIVQGLREYKIFQLGGDQPTGIVANNDSLAVVRTVAVKYTSEAEVALISPSENLGIIYPATLKGFQDGPRALLPY